MLTLKLDKNIKGILEKQANKNGRSLEDEALEILRNSLGEVKTQNLNHNIMELEGLGKEIWQNIDTQEYINQERDSWNG